ncbi:MAG: LysR substrate-binding domain-containing protein [Janthinobacterium lividum]
MTVKDLKIRQVEAFRAVIERRTVTAAAAMLHVSQPAVSRLIADFEASVGFRLFDRQQGRLVATAEAHVLFEEVERAFTGLDRIALAAQQIRTMRRGSLRIAGSPAMALELLPRAVAAFVQAHPGVDVTLLTHSSRTVVELVAARRCDIGFAAEAVPHPAVRLERLMQAPMRCIAPPGHPLKARRIVRPEDLRDASFVSYPPSFDARTLIDRVFVEHDVARRMCVEAQLSQTIAALVAQGAGVALIDPITAAFMKDRLVVRRFEPAVMDQVYLANAIAQPVSTLAQAFVAQARETLDGIL